MFTLPSSGVSIKQENDYPDGAKALLVSHSPDCLDDNDDSFDASSPA